MKFCVLHSASLIFLTMFMQVYAGAFSRATVVPELYVAAHSLLLSPQGPSVACRCGCALHASCWVYFIVLDCVAFLRVSGSALGYIGICV